MFGIDYDKNEHNLFDWKKINLTADTVFLLVHNPALHKIYFHANFRIAIKMKQLCKTSENMSFLGVNLTCKTENWTQSNMSLTTSQGRKSLRHCLLLVSAKSPQPFLSGLFCYHLGLPLGCDNLESNFEECGIKLTCIDAHGFQYMAQFVAAIIKNTHCYGDWCFHSCQSMMFLFKYRAVLPHQIVDTFISILCVSLFTLFQQFSLV